MTHVTSSVVHPNIGITGHLMIHAGLLNHFTFCDYVMYVISVDIVKNANSFVR